MSNIQATQAFYSLTLEPPSAPTAACTCNAIAGGKRQDQQIFEVRGQHLLLQKVVENDDKSEVKVSTVLDHDAFGIIRGVAAFRIPGTSSDQLVVASDSGRVALLTYDADKNTFNRVHLETYGKSGIRRTIPGQYLAADPRGRCFMLGCAEKNKVVYIVNRNAEGGILISSPHEANTAHHLCFALCALDTYWDNPIFATLEVDYSDAENDPDGDAYVQRTKQLVYYTVDLGLNHVVKTWSGTVDYTANMLFGVPGGQDGPSGVLVCAEDRIYWRHGVPGSPALCLPIPRRRGATEDPERKRRIVAGALHHSKLQKDFFFLLQTDDGDVFKLRFDLEWSQQGDARVAVPEKMTMRYYETVPVATQLLLLKKGYLYVAAENGSSKLYHVLSLGDDLDVEPENYFTSDGVSPDPDDTYEPTSFTPRGLTHLALACEVPGLHPLMRTRVENLTGEDAPQIYSVQGTGNNSLFKTTRHGLEISEIVSSPLGNITFDNLWSLKHRLSDLYHSYLLLSSNYGDKTIVLSIGDEVETMEDSSFLTNRATLTAQQMGDATLVQVHSRGVHSILESGAINEWPVPQHRTIVAASANERQLLLGLSSAELAFFFMGDDGVLNQLEEMPEMSGKVTALSVGQTPRGQQQAKFAVVGCDDCTVRVLSIELDSPLEARSVQALSAVPTSIEVIEMLDPSSNTRVNYVHIGLQSGLYLRAIIDELTGELGEVRTKFLGARPTRLFPVTVEQDDAIISCSTRPWLGYNNALTKLYTLTPLITGQLEAARSFVTEHIPDGLCAIQGSNLLIYNIPSVEGRLTSTSIPLNYTPRAMTRNPWFPIWYVAQSDGNTISAATKASLLDKQKNGHSDVDMDESEKQDLERHIGHSRAPGHWASCISAIDPINGHQITSNVELTENEAALCAAVVPFESRQWECFLAVGTGQHMQPGTGTQSKGFVHIYKLLEDGQKLELYHKTELPQPIYALLPFNGRLALGSGTDLLIYDLGLKALLRKSRAPSVVPNMLVTLSHAGSNRLVCGDASESLTYVVYKPKHNRLIPFADDTTQRWTTASTTLDYETSASADKFGNIYMLRCPELASQEADDDTPGGHLANERPYLNGAPHRLDLRVHTFTSDICTSLQKTSLVPGGQDVLFWSGLQGTMGIFVPFAAREDVDFFSQLEALLRSEDAPIAGRDHLAFRSYYAPVKGVVDGDLCERFLRLGYDKRQRIAAELERGVREVERKVVEMRGRVAF